MYIFEVKKITANDSIGLIKKYWSSKIDDFLSHYQN